MEINSMKDLIEHLAKNPPKFESKPYHESGGPGTVVWFFSGEDHWAEWVNPNLTVYHGRETKKIVGIQVSDRILDTERRPRPRPSK